MSESVKTIIKYFSDRFLNLDYYSSSNKLKEIEIVRLPDLIQLEDYGFENLIEKLSLNRTTLKNALIAFSFINHT
ncbi:MAG: hypothetical protein ACFFB0_13290 [Promethearchaeota archaeon]